MYLAILRFLLLRFFLGLFFASARIFLTNFDDSATIPHMILFKVLFGGGRVGLSLRQSFIGFATFFLPGV